MSYHIGQYFKRQDAEGSAAHILSHMVLSAAVAAAGGNDAATAAVAAGGAEAVAPIVSRWLYGKEAKDLNADEKATITAISALAGAGIGATKGNMADTVSGSVAAQNAVENNWLSAIQLMDIEKAFLACNADAACEQKVKDSAQTLSQLQDSRLAWAKIKCIVGNCQDLEAIQRQIAYSGNLNLVYSELQKRYPTAASAELRAAAQVYSKEAYDSYEKSTSRFAIGILDTLPALGLTGTGISQSTRGAINIVKQNALKSASSREAAEQIAKHPLLNDAIERAGTPSRPIINQGNIPTCGHNCATMVLNQQGKAVNVDDLIKLIPPSKEGILGRQVESLFKQNGINAQFVTKRNIDDLVRYTAQGKPVVVRIQDNHFSHFVVVDGVTTRNGVKVIAVRDPHGIQYFSPASTFNKSFTGEVIFTK